MSYQDAALLSQMLSMAIFGAVMAGALVYALRPGNKSHFERAAQLALEGDETCGRESKDGR